MFRFYITIILHIITAIIFILTLKRANRNKKLTKEERWSTGRNVAMKIGRLSWGVVHVEGEENLPEKPGYMLLPNHQGRFDGIAVTTAHKNPLSFVLREDRSNIILEGDFMRLTGAVPIVIGDVRQNMGAMQTVMERIAKGDNFCIFPEGGYTENANVLSDFKTGCIHYLKKYGCPIIPVCIHDSWRVFNYSDFRDVFRKIHVSVCFLKPILPEEYMDLSKPEIIAMVKERIQDKMDEMMQRGGLYGTGSKA